MRRVHFHKNGTVTARLEITVTGEADRGATDASRRETKKARIRGVDGFVERHIARVTESFDGEISSAADGLYERFAAEGRAYRFRPCVIYADYKIEAKGAKTAVYISISASSGRRVITEYAARHRFLRVLGEDVYRGAKK